MATLFNTKISATYPGLIKTIDNTALSATLKQLTDGSGTASGVFMNTAGDFKVNSILEFGSLKDTGENIIITKFVDAADGIANNNNDTSIPTSSAVKTYVDAVVTASDLDFLGDTGFGAVDLDSQNFSIEGTLNQITTSASNQTIKLSLPNNVEISGVFEGATFVGDLNGTINTDTTAFTQIAGTSNQTVATTKFVMDLDSASDLDFSGDSGTGDVNLNTESLAITGTTNQIVTAANLTGLSLSLPATVHRDLQGNVTGNVQGDLTGNVTATSVLADGVTATTQASSDSSEKIATTAYVKGLDNASDLDITGDSGTGDVNLNTQTLNILGTTNEITTAVVNQTATISLPSTISVNVIGNVTGDLTGNADTATKWQTARDLSLTGQATGTLSNVDGALAVSGAVTLDNNSVTGKVLTGLASPSASSVLATDSILEAFGKVQSQVNGLANGLRFIGSWDASSNSPVLSSGGGEAANGTTTSTLTNKLVDSSASFTSTVTIGDQVVNQVDGQIALVTNIDSNTTLSLDADIMLTSEAYTIDNSPFITQGHYYVVSVGGTTSLNGINTWSVGDWVIAGANNEWTKLDHSQVDGTGTTGNIPKWSSTSVIADSIMAESGSVITVSGTLSTTTNLNSGSNFAVATDKFTANATTGNVAFPGDLAINTNKFTVNATNGNVDFLGDLAINTDKFTVNATSGNTLVGGTLDSGTITTTGNINLDGNIIDSGELSIYVNTSQRAQWIQSSGYSIFDANSQTMAIFKGGTDDRKLIIGSNGSNTLLKSSVNSTSANAGFEFQTGTTTALTIDTSQNSTFAGRINGVVGGTAYNTAGLWLQGNSSTDGISIGGTGGGDKNIDTYGGALNLQETSQNGVNMWGNVGIGVTPSSWETISNSNALQFYGSYVYNYRDTNLIIGNNAYYDGAWRYYKASIGATKFNSGNGAFDFAVSSSGNANDPITWIDALKIDSSGNVGIGVSTINNPFSAQAALQVGDTSTTTNNGLITIGSGTAGSGDIYFADGTSGGSAYKGFVSYKHNDDYLAFGTAETTRMIIDSSGNVGIGNTNPSDYGADANNLVVGSLVGNNGITILSSSSSGYGSIYFADGTTSTAYYSGYISYQQNQSNMAFGTNGVERMRIDVLGNVGIGTDSPSAKLEIKDSANNNSNLLTLYRPNNSLAAASYIDFSFNTANGTQAVYSRIQSDNDGNTDSAQSGSLSFWTPSSGTLAERMRITSGGEVLFSGKTALNLNTIGTEFRANGQCLFIADGDNAVDLNRLTNNGAIALFRQAGIVVGNISVTGSATAYNTTNSDERLKKNITKWDENILDKFKDIQPKEFHFNQQEDIEEKQKGYIAQNEVDKFPEAYPLVYNEEAKEDRHSFNPSGMTVYLMKAIQELKAEVDKLKQECKCKN